jgi:hypothetical protein
VTGPRRGTVRSPPANEPLLRTVLGGGPPGGTDVFGLAVLLVLSLLAGVGTVGLADHATAPRPANGLDAGLATLATTISLAPTTGTPATSVLVTGSGFTSGSTVTILFDNASVTTTPSPCKASTGGSVMKSGGAISCSFSAPVGFPGANNVTASDGTHTVWTAFTETGVLGLDPYDVDVGQNVTVSGSGFGSSLVISTFTVDNLTVNCTSATVGSCASGVLTTSAGGAFNATIAAPSVSASGTYEVAATDSASTKELAELTVYLDPTLTGLTASPTSVDLGQSFTLRATLHYGSGGFTYNWTGLPGCPGAGDPMGCLPSTNGTTAINLTVRDSNGEMARAGPLTLTVFRDPLVTRPTANVSSLDVGQSVTLSTTASSGTGTYRQFNWTGLPPGCSGNTSSLVCTPTAPVAGPDAISVQVLDSNDRTSVVSPTLDLTVAVEPTLSLPQANRSSSDVGQEVQFSDPASGGSGSFIYDWSGLPSSCGASGPNVSCSFPAPGNLSVSVSATDANHDTLTSLALPFTVYADPTVALSANRTTIEASGSVSLSASPALGSGGFLYSWTGLPENCTIPRASGVCSGVAPGNYSITVVVTDSNGVAVPSAPLSLEVADPLLGIIATVPTGPTAGMPVTFTASGGGGIAPLSFAWAFGDGQEGSGSSVRHTYGSGGSFTVELWVNDSGGQSVEKSTQLTVASAPSATPAASGGGGSELEITALGLLGALVVIAGVAVFLRRRRRGSRPQEEEGIPEASLYGDPADGSTDE